MATNDLMSAMSAAASGLRAQTVRIRVSAENLANADTTATTPGGDPYRRKAPVFRSFMDRESGTEKVKVTGEREDQTPFSEKFDPSNPGADARGGHAHRLREFRDLLLALRQEFMQRRIEQADRHRQPAHDLEQGGKVAALHRQ